MTRRNWTATGLEVLDAVDFENDRLRSKDDYVVAFGASWCPWTRAFVRRFREWGGGLRGRLAIADISDRKSVLWDVFRIRVSPTVLCFSNGRAVFRLDGRLFRGIRERNFESVVAFIGDVAATR